MFLVLIDAYITPVSARGLAASMYAWQQAAVNTSHDKQISDGPPLLHTPSHPAVSAECVWIAVLVSCFLYRVLAARIACRHAAKAPAHVMS